MRRLGKWTVSGSDALRALAAAATLGSAALGPAGCGGDEPNNQAGSTATASSTAGGTGGGGGAGGAGAGGQGGAGGGDSTVCTSVAPGPTRGSAIAITPDDSRIVVANRDAGSVTVLAVDSSDGPPKLSIIAELPIGGEPWQVAIDGCGDTAYVALRRDQKVVEIRNIASAPEVGAEVAVGSEPTGLALTPNNKTLYVASWVDGSLTTIDALAMAKTGSIDLNKALADTGLLGAVAPRPALAHPRSVAITNNGDGSDADEKVYVTEFFAQRAAPESADGKNADASKKGLLYSVKVDGGAVTTVDLGPIADTGFNDDQGQATGCFPNQLESVTIHGGFAYVTSICASPAGPLGVFQRAACATDADCGGVAMACSQFTKQCVCTAANQEQVCGGGGTCNTMGQPTGSCNPNVTNVKTTTHPALHVVDTATDMEVPAAATNLDKKFNDLYDSAGPAVPDDASRRMPHIANDIAFAVQQGVAYVSAGGADAVFRIKVDPATGGVVEVGRDGYPHFIDLAPAGITDPLLKGASPIGIAAANKLAFAFTANDASRNVSAVDLDKQIVAGLDLAPKAPRVLTTSPLPADAAGQSILRGKRAFNTGLGRWSLKGQAWGSCQACHIDGLSDNVTWYFARGPRQSTSLDGSFASKDPTDQRIFNWTAILDEVADFELNTRSVSGGVGALVTKKSDPPDPADRISLTPQVGDNNSGLNGSTEDVTASLSVVKDWDDIKAYMRSIRSPRAPSNLDPAAVAAGKDLFALQGGCAGCHGGPKWTISKRFYQPSVATNMALLTAKWDSVAVVGAGFPDVLLPAITQANQVMRYGGGSPAAFDQILCGLRPVGTFKNAPADVGVAEKRSDMTTTAQGDPQSGDGRGYNPPSLLNLQAGAPYFHAGNARTLEESLTAAFNDHWASPVAAAGFLGQSGQIESLVAFLLSIDEGTTPIDIPALGKGGGDFCAAP